MLVVDWRLGIVGLAVMVPTVAVIGGIAHQCRKAVLKRRLTPLVASFLICGCVAAVVTAGHGRGFGRFLEFLSGPFAEFRQILRDGGLWMVVVVIPLGLWLLGSLMRPGGASAHITALGTAYWFFFGFLLSLWRRVGA